MPQTLLAARVPTPPLTYLTLATALYGRGNSDSEYIPRVRQQYEINLKPRHMRDELSHRFLLVLY